MSDAKRGRVLTAARSVFLRYGYRRANMNDIAEGAGISRPALYLLFKNKEEVFIGVLTHWVDETIEDIGLEITNAKTPKESIERAFEVWSVRPFEMTMASPEAKELLECGFDFAQDSLHQGYKRFEAALVPALRLLAETQLEKEHVDAERTARVLASAVRGFKQTATTAAELRLLIADLLALCVSAHP